MRQLVLWVGLIVAVVSTSIFAQAKIESLPPSLTSSQTRIEEDHAAGMSKYFKDLNQDCDQLEVLHVIYRQVPKRAGSPQFFRIESRVLASCESQRMWYCESSFTQEPRNLKYNHTECEVDGPEFEE